MLRASVLSLRIRSGDRASTESSAVEVSIEGAAPRGLDLYHSIRGTSVGRCAQGPVGFNELFRVESGRVHAYFHFC